MRMKLSLWLIVTAYFSPRLYGTGSFVPVWAFAGLLLIFELVP